MRSVWLSVLLGLGAVGCASNLPQGVREAPEAGPPLSAVRADPEAFMGRTVRWGGTIAQVQNRPQETCIEVVERDLRSGGRPLESGQSEGRFITCMNGFLDPAIYGQGRLLTVSGRIAATETGRVGEYPYRYPVVQAQSHHLWESEPERVYVEPDPFWGSPWGFWPSPFLHPWYGYPRPWHFHHHHR
jgi:outer membrane lipoprotein